MKLQQCAGNGLFSAGFSPVLILFSIIIPPVFIILSGIFVFRTFNRWRSGVPEARLRLRLIRIFTFAVLGTLLLLGLFAFLFIRLVLLYGSQPVFLWIFLAGLLILLVLLSGILFSGRVIRPLAALGEAAEKASRKAWQTEYALQPLSDPSGEMDFFIKSINQMIGEREGHRVAQVQSEKVATWKNIAQQLAHELRNPLTPIKLSAQRIQLKALEGRLDDKTLQNTLELILNKVDIMDEMLQAFRDFAGSSSPRPERFCLQTILKEAVEEFRKKEPDIQWAEASGSTDTNIWADKKQIRQVIIILLKNASEAKAGKVTTYLEPAARSSDKYLRLRIEDDGEGIDPAQGQKIFQPYVTSRPDNSGLGLAIAERIIYDHQGRIWFEPNTDSGTSFFIDLPVGENT